VRVRGRPARMSVQESKKKLLPLRTLALPTDAHSASAERSTPSKKGTGFRKEWRHEFIEKFDFGMDLLTANRGRPPIKCKTAPPMTIGKYRSKASPEHCMDFYGFDPTSSPFAKTKWMFWRPIAPIAVRFSNFVSVAIERSDQLVAAKNVDQDVAVDESQSSPRNKRMMSSVDIAPNSPSLIGRRRAMSSRRAGNADGDTGGISRSITIPPSGRARTTTRSPRRMPAASRTAFGSVTCP
jgi:hypothetical protein